MPRGVSLIRDYVDVHKRRQRAAIVDAYRRTHPSSPSRPSNADLTDAQRELLTRCLTLWRAYPDSSTHILSQSHTEAPSSGAPAPRPHKQNGSYTPPAQLSALARPVPINPTVLKAGTLLTPSAAGDRWERRRVELRPPYLHLYSAVTGDQLAAVNLARSRVDRDPVLPEGLGRTNGVAGFALYAATKGYLFACQGERERAEWVWAVDRCYYAEEEEAGHEQGSSGDESDEEEEEEGGYWGRGR